MSQGIVRNAKKGKSQLPQASCACPTPFLAIPPGFRIKEKAPKSSCSHLPQECNILLLPCWILRNDSPEFWALQGSCKTTIWEGQSALGLANPSPQDVPGSTDLWCPEPGFGLLCSSHSRIQIRPIPCTAPAPRIPHKAAPLLSQLSFPGGLGLHKAGRKWKKLRVRTEGWLGSSQSQNSWKSRSIQFPEPQLDHVFYTKVLHFYHSWAAQGVWDFIKLGEKPKNSESQQRDVQAALIESKFLKMKPVMKWEYSFVDTCGCDFLRG